MSHADALANFASGSVSLGENGCGGFTEVERTLRCASSGSGAHHQLRDNAWSFPL